MFYQQQPQQIRPYLEFQAHDVNGAKSSFDSSLAVNATSRTIGVVLLEAPSFGRFLQSCTAFQSPGLDSWLPLPGSHSLHTTLCSVCKLHRAEAHTLPFLQCIHQKTDPSYLRISDSPLLPERQNPAWQVPDCGTAYSLRASSSECRTYFPV